MKNYSFFLMTILSFLHSNALAWGMTGHRIVGGLAEHYLQPETKAYVRNVLEGAKLQDVSTWADDVRSEQTPWSKSIEPWHYINYDQPSASTLAKSDIKQANTKKWPNNVSEAIDYLQHQLQTNPNLSSKEQAILVALLVHMVADAHQPFHAGFSDDVGGNTCKIYWFRKGGWKTTLHAVWDSRMIDGQRLSYSEWVDYLLPKHAEEIASWRQASPRQWVEESHALVRDLYPTTPTGSQDKTLFCGKASAFKNSDIPVLGYAYQYQHRPLLDKRLHQAGVRLALLLDTIVAKRSA